MIIGYLTSALFQSAKREKETRVECVRLELCEYVYKTVGYHYYYYIPKKRASPGNLCQ